MGEKFLRFKRRANLIRLARAAFIGVGSGALVTGVLNLLLRLELISLDPVLLVLIGLGTALLVGAPLYLFVRLSDRGLARVLDEELSLDERVETMLEYMGDESEMHRLQRENAEAVLGSLPTSRLKFKRLWLYVVIAAFGILALGASFLFAKPVPPPPPVIPPEGFELTEFQSRSIEVLIAEVEASDMDEIARTKTVELLKSLHEVLKVTKTKDEKNAAVLLTMKGILTEIDSSSYAVEIINALWRTDHEPLRALAKALNYYSWQKLSEWDMYMKSVEVFSAALKYVPDAEPSPAEEDDLALNAAVLLYSKSSTGISGVIEGCRVPEGDALATALIRLALAREEYDDGTRVYGLLKLSEMLSSDGYAATERETEATMTALAPIIYAALTDNMATTSMGEHAVERLDAILDCTPPAFERPSFPEASGGGGQPSDEEIGEGGAISGGTEYGSDDLVLDPYTNTYVEYGTLLDRYYALMIGSVDNGNHTDKEREALMKYFTILYGGFEERE